ncbi:hypothetical protein LTR97_003017 [Elasticomyces elasticus]|uniref:Uncharacterized protein n=1 Tax=Elasticomyces elasticus TaxID=574655 RepID=A0AAN7WFY5_9PEZI|nr:hypothetical protein LTR97_003017 [Elasticomyces elasticus]
MATNGAANGHKSHNMSPKITLYTNHSCPYAQRAHITLDSLNLKYEEVIIDLATPRPQWYLDINPRGLVPSIKYSVPGIIDEEIVTESAIVAQFLCDMFPSPLLPASKESPTSALFRARVNFFVDTWNTKIAPVQMSIMKASSDSEKVAECTKWAEIIKKEIEPLLANVNPFFGGSSELTFVEVFTAPFILRWFAFIKDGEMFPSSLGDKLDALPNFTKWRKAIQGNEHVVRVFDEEAIVSSTKKRVKQMQAK